MGGTIRPALEVHQNCLSVEVEVVAKEDTFVVQEEEALAETGWHRADGLHLNAVTTAAGWKYFSFISFSLICFFSTVTKFSENVCVA